MASLPNLLVDTGTTESTERTITDDRTLEAEIDEAVRSLVGEISERFVPQPSNESRTIDVVNGIGEFKTRCRWAEYWRNRNIERALTEQTVWAAYYHEHPELLSASLWERSRTDPNWQWPDPTSKLTYEQEADICDKMEKTAGLGTGLKRENPKSKAPAGSPDLECFLKQLEEELLKQSVDEEKSNNRAEHENSARVKSVLKELKTSELVVVPTDKTNSFRTMNVERYKMEINKHLSKNAIVIERAKLTEIHDSCSDKLEELQELASEKELAFLDEKIRSKAIPQPKILIKDHKEPDAEGNFPTRLVVPATNFTAGFPKLGYKGIKSVFEEHDIDFEARTITQASSLKENLEELGLKRGDCTIASIDAEAMYPSIKFDLIKKAVEYYARNITDENEIDKVNKCLDLIKFGMNTTLIQFCGVYYLYDGDKEVEDRGLTIGGYESAWLADLAMAFLLETFDQSVIDETKYFGIYRDDGIAAFPGTWTQAEIGDWLSVFQGAVNDVAGNDKLLFTAEVWTPGEEKAPKVRGKVGAKTADCFPFLDMELSWSDEGILQFGVHLKPNQQLKYLNAGSAHTPGCFKAITTGVCYRLTKLTTVDENNVDLKLDEAYPEHFGALNKAGLLKNFEPPTLGAKAAELEAASKDEVGQATKKRRERDRKRAIYFKVGFSHYWRKPIHKTIREVKSRFPSLKWLRVSMSYHRFSNLRELFQGDLNTKLNRNVISKDFQILPCNCRNKKACPYGGKCRHSIVVYQTTCLQTNKRYIGNTQQHVKTRTQGHVQDVKKLFIDGKSSDSFASHFASLVPEGTAKKNVKDFVKVKVDILWQGDPLSCVKTFGTRGCKLCAKERYAIIKLTRETPNLAINKCNEVHGACRHRPRFHRFDHSGNANSSTDESGRTKGSQRPSSITSTGSTGSNDTLGSFNDRRGEPLLGPEDPVPTYWENRSNGLRARSLLTTEEPDLPQVESNLNESPQEDLAVTVEYTEV